MAAVSVAAWGMIPAYSDCWLVNVDGAVPFSSNAAKSAGVAVCPSPCARTVQKLPNSGAVIGGAVAARAAGAAAAAAQHAASTPRTRPRLIAPEDCQTPRRRASGRAAVRPGEQQRDGLEVAARLRC